MLATPEKHILYKDDLMNEIKLEDFLSLLTKDTFVGYALSQIKKAKGLNKKMFHPMEVDRKSILDFCYVVESDQTQELKNWLHFKNLKQEYCGLSKLSHLKDMYALYYSKENELRYDGIYSSDESNDISLSSIPKNGKALALLYFNKDAYSTYCKKFREYWDWVEKRNIHRFQTNKMHGKGYDTKNMMHTIRLLQLALNIFKEQKLLIEVKNREELLSIKNGEFSYDEMVKKADDLITEIEKYAKESNLMEFPDIMKVEELLVSLRLKLYN